MTSQFSEFPNHLLTHLKFVTPAQWNMVSEKDDGWFSSGVGNLSDLAVFVDHGFGNESALFTIPMHRFIDNPD